MTLNSISLTFQRISRDFADFGHTNSYKQMKIDQYCQRQRCKHVELEQFLACFRAARVCLVSDSWAYLFFLHNDKSNHVCILTFLQCYFSLLASWLMFSWKKRLI